MKQVTVVGCGIVGLTAAIVLQEKGYRVRIVAKEHLDRSLSHKVGAIWFPFEVHPIAQAIPWAECSYQHYLKEKDHSRGVSFIPFMVASDAKQSRDWMTKLPKGAVRAALEDELPLGLDEAFIATVPLAEPPIYLPYLFDKFLSNGGEFEIRELTGVEELSQLDSLVINCTGLGAKVLCHDQQLYPMRGQILRCEKSDLLSYVNSTVKGNLCYVINRSEDCIVGGTDYENDWNMSVDEEDTRMILDRVITNGLSKTKPALIETLVGLRPMRSSVRFEFDPVYKNVFHNYGHGGAGFTVAWGCAFDLGNIIG